MYQHLIPLALATLRNRKGVTAAEYAVLAVGVVVAVGTAAATLGTTISNKFANLFAAS